LHHLGSFGCEGNNTQDKHTKGENCFGHSRTIFLFFFRMVIQEPGGRKPRQRPIPCHHFAQKREDDHQLGQLVLNNWRSVGISNLMVQFTVAMTKLAVVSCAGADPMKLPSHPPESY
jgi:hypothetical protein